MPSAVRFTESVTKADGHLHCSVRWAGQHLKWTKRWVSFTGMCGWLLVDFDPAMVGAKSGPSDGQQGLHTLATTYVVSRGGYDDAKNTLWVTLPSP